MCTAGHVMLAPDELRWARGPTTPPRLTKHPAALDSEMR
jgi:hypothetical protein